MSGYLDLLQREKRMPGHASEAGAIDAMIGVSPDRVELLSVAELATYGIKTLDAVAWEERRAHAQLLPR